MADKKILKIVRDFKKKMQASVDHKGAGFTKITMQIGNRPPVVIAERKKNGRE
jgi:hypothetical protein